VGKDNEQERVELTPRQMRDLERLTSQALDPDGTDESRADAAGITVGYIRSAMWRRS
jgi:hypothetical protein